MFNFGELIDLFSLRITEADTIVELLVDRDVNKPLDCRAEHRSAVTPKIAGQIASATDETDAEGSTTDDHAN